MAAGRFVSQTRPSAFDWARPMPVFFALQIADLLTTVIFRSMGVAETNPLAQFLMEQFGTLIGLLVLKTTAICVGLACGIASHPVFVRRLNGVYCLIVALNYLTICNVIRR
jgi:hypothetical protein